MADIADHISKIITILKKQGFEKDFSGIEKGFAWKPDILVTRNSESIAFLIRQTDSFPESLIERLTSTKTRKRKLFINVLFLTRPSSPIKKKLALHGLGAQQLDENKIIEFTKSKNFSSVKEPAKVIIPHEKMMKTEIFISSQQKICERKLTHDVIEDIRNRDKFPVYPFQVEDDPRFGGSTAQTKKCIDEGLDYCEWFVAILSEEWRHWVEYEIKQAVKIYFKDKDITIYVRTTKKTDKAWKLILTWIKKRNLKYLPYSDTADLKNKLSRRILAKIERVHRNLGIPMYNS
jgi:hypothetical protein